jgi:hypothetical protein
LLNDPFAEGESSVVSMLIADDVQRVLDACPRTTAVGRRDYAILLLLARLGLRGGEIVRLELDDIDWHAGALLVRGKGSVRSHLPLPCDVGEAVAAYLQRDRPRCATRRVFVRAGAPHRGLGPRATVSTLVRVALTRAGVNAPIHGAHLRRHSLATDLLRRGASMADIGDVTARIRSLCCARPTIVAPLFGLRRSSAPLPAAQTDRLMVNGDVIDRCAAFSQQRDDPPPRGIDELLREHSTPLCPLHKDLALFAKPFTSHLEL